MKRILIFGNSGSGKSTLAKSIGRFPSMAYLDLDTVAWKPDQPGVREDELVSLEKMDAFMRSSEQWVVEGCYSGLISHFLSRATQLIFMNPGVETCIANCKARPWEPHKYASKEEQDELLEFLLEWVKEYETREDEFSLEAHRELLGQFAGLKLEVRSNEEGEALKRDFENSLS